MSFTTIEFEAPSIGAELTLQRPSGSNLATNGPLSQGVFGIDNSDDPYYNVAGPTVGQAAVLGFDGSIGGLFLDSRNPPDPGGTLSTATVDLAEFAGSVTARWYDPTDGDYTAISGSPFTNSGTHTFTPPGTNNAGDSDWVLLLQAP